MPKWEQTLPPADLFEWLCPRGFCPGARFEGIAPDIFISAALHGAKVIVDEKGTEAAASTALFFPTSMPPEPDLRIVADRPFPVGHRPPGHRRSPVRGPPRQPGRVVAAFFAYVFVVTTSAGLLTDLIL